MPRVATRISRAQKAALRKAQAHRWALPLQPAVNPSSPGASLYKLSSKASSISSSPLRSLLADTRNQLVQAQQSLTQVKNTLYSKNKTISPTSQPIHFSRNQLLIP
jgi:hypothetical protein